MVQTKVDIVLFISLVNKWLDYLKLLVTFLRLLLIWKSHSWPCCFIWLSKSIWNCTFGLRIKGHWFPMFINAKRAVCSNVSTATSALAYSFSLFGLKRILKLIIMPVHIAGPRSVRYRKVPWVKVLCYFNWSEKTVWGRSKRVDLWKTGRFWLKILSLVILLDFIFCFR